MAAWLFRGFGVWIAVAIAGVVAAFMAVPTVASAAPSRPVSSAASIALRAGGGAPSTTTLQCVTPAQMLREGGSTLTVGSTFRNAYYGYRVLLLDRECKEIDRWYWTSVDNLTYGTVEALETVMHEAQHTRGVHTEWVAECRAIQPVLAYLSKYHATRQELQLASDYLYHGMEKYRPLAYKLRGRCI
jgi:hypothetical protein